jgi:hypothetical protein
LPAPTALTDPPAELGQIATRVASFLPDLTPTRHTSKRFRQIEAGRALGRRFRRPLSRQASYWAVSTNFMARRRDIRQIQRRVPETRVR